MIERELPAGWSCQTDGDGVLIGGDEASAGELVRISLEKLYKGVEQEPEKRRELLYETVDRVKAIIMSRTASRDLCGQEKRVFPVLRHASFAAQAEKGIVIRTHTEETRIAFALDQDNGYLLVDKQMLAQASWTEDQLSQHAMENLRSLSV
ncbi:DUF1444 family protein, partial [Microbacteriaceae bacterium K1510]|nr:DUF1444 family protein [Microbacteriaceae bacterium K1510]